jgi:succinoglycan biosynthesis transport protein ExoP
MDDFTPLPEGQGSVAPISHRSKSPTAPASVYVANPYSYEAVEGPDSEVGLFQYWAVIRHNGRTIVAASFVGLLLGFFVSFAITSIYRATTTIEILAMNENFMNMRERNPVDNNTDSDVSEVETQAQLLGSATMFKRVAARLDPQAAQAPKTKQPVPAPAWQHVLHLDPAWLHKLHLAPAGSMASSPDLAARTNARTVLISKASESLKVRPMPHTRIIEATVKSADPQLAADFLNILAQEFIDQNQEARLVTSQHTGDWLNRELNEARDKLRQSEDALQEYARGSGLVYTNETTNVATEKLQQYQQALSNATTDRILKQARFELAQTSPPDSLADVLNDAALRDLQLKITDLKRQIADLSTVFNSEFSKVRRVEAELQSLQAAFDRSRTDVLNRIKTDFEEASRRERLLSNAYDKQTADVTGQGEKAIQYNILKRDVDSNRQLYDAMSQQMKQASIATAMRASSARIVDAAEVPGEPDSPSFKLNSAVGLLGGLLLSTIAVLVRSEADRTLRSQGDIKRWTELPELGAIPNASGAGSYYLYNSPSTAELRKVRVRLSTSPSVRLSISPSTLGDGVKLATWQGSATLLAESFRCALTSMLSMGEDGARPHVLVIASGNPAEGKTTAAVNIAIAASEVHLRVLVIDADLRRPRVHHMFNLSNERGLVDCLRQPMTEDAIGSLVRPSTVPNLDVLTSGPETTAAARLLHSSNFATLIRRFRAEYDMILIDTPPMLQMTDARIVGRQADGVILVARARRTAREDLLAAKERFVEDRVPVLGCILNDWDPKRSSETHYRSQVSVDRTWG